MSNKVLRDASGLTQTLIAVGDVCLSGLVREVIEQKGADFIFEAVKPWFRGADFRFANLECCVVRTCENVPPQRLDMLAPETAMPALSAMFNVMSVANNHICDYGRRAFINCLTILRQNSIATAGGGKTRREAEEATILSKNGISVGWLAYADWEFGAAVSNASGLNTPGVAILSKRRIMKAVRSLKHNVDIVVVSLHTDIEFADDPDPARIRLCRSIAKSGADVILCHHPHVPQGLEVYDNCLIAYGLGNCVFPVCGNLYMETNSSHTKHSFALRVILDKQGIVQYELLPFQIDTDHRPVPLTGLMAGQLIAHINALSLRLNDRRAIFDKWTIVSRRFIVNHLLNQYYELRKGSIYPLLRFLWVIPHRVIRRAMLGFLYSCLRS
jgi:poly-gamma-glutamate synthesis protein (capsule biosynthesis protein)